MAELTVDNLYLRYGDNPILKGVAMTLNRGEVVSLLGPSGSGKTTLLRAVAGLEVPHEGTILIGDKVVFDGARRASTYRPRDAISASCSSRTRCGRTRRCSTTSAYALKLRSISRRRRRHARAGGARAALARPSRRAAFRISFRAASSSASRSPARSSTTRR